VCCDELFKLCLCTVVMVCYYVFKVPVGGPLELPRLGEETKAGYGAKSLGGLVKFMKTEIFGHGTKEILKLALPAICYTIQKNCLYVAITHLEAAVYMVTYQAKILTTAIFSCALLRKPMSFMQVLALCLLMAGVSLVQLSSMEAAKPSSEEDDESRGYVQRPFLGLAAVLVACCTSGFSGVWFELVLKTPNFTHSGVDRALAQEFAMWVRNIHLAMFALLAALIGAYSKDGALIQEKGFLQGYTPVTYLVVVLEASGGIIVAIVIKYADNILKNFATAISIVTATAISAAFLDFQVTPLFFLGTLIVLAAVTLYQRNPPDGNNTCKLCLCAGKKEGGAC